MVVILARPDDRCACRVHESLRQRGTDVLFIEESQLFSTAGLNWSVLGPPDESFLVSGAARFPWAAISGVLVRLQGPSSEDRKKSDPDQTYTNYERHAALVGLLNALEGAVVNRPPPGAPWQFLQSRRLPWISGDKAPLIPSHGFRLPRMVVTSSEAQACSHYARFGRAALIDAPSGQGPWRWIGGEAGEREIQAMLTRCPVRLLEAPAGQWLQVFTVGKRAFAAASERDLGTAEYQQRRWSSVPLTADLQARCGGLAQSFGLDFAQVRLLLTEAGDPYCMGIGEWPVLDRCEEPLQEQIAAALADLLAGEVPGSAYFVWRSRYLPDRIRNTQSAARTTPHGSEAT